MGNPAAITLIELNSAPPARALGALAPVFEGSPWIAERALWDRPFATADALFAALQRAVLSASQAEQLALVRAHPELAGREAIEGRVTAESRGEQGRLGFTALPRHEFERMAELNRAYRERFGFPCIVALREHATRQSVMDTMARRLANDPARELETALAQVFSIARGRLDTLLGLASQLHPQQHGDVA